MVNSWELSGSLVHQWRNCLFVHILQERERFFKILLKDHREPVPGRGFVNADWFCFAIMDPGRYGLQQGWDNNSVIVVSSLIITYMG